MTPVELREAAALADAHRKTFAPFTADTLDRLVAEVIRLQELVADYENGINWGVSCKGCADQLDVSIRAYEDGYEAGVRSQIGPEEPLPWW